MKTAKQKNEQMALIIACMECLWIQDCADIEEEESVFEKYRDTDTNPMLLNAAEIQKLIAA